MKFGFSNSFIKPVVKDQYMFAEVDIDMVLITLNDCIQRTNYFSLCIEHTISEYDSNLPKNLQCSQQFKGVFQLYKNFKSIFTITDSLKLMCVFFLHMSWTKNMLNAGGCQQMHIPYKLSVIFLYFSNVCQASGYHKYVMHRTEI